MRTIFLGGSAAKLASEGRQNSNTKEIRKTERQSKLAGHVAVLKASDRRRGHPRKDITENLPQLEMRPGRVARFAVGELAQHQAVDLTKYPGVAQLREHAVEVTEPFAHIF